MSRLLPVLSAALLAACTPSGPAPDTATWVRQLQPLLSENGLLAARMLEAAAQVHDGQASPTTAALTWETELAPLAVHLHHQADLVQPPARWVTAHEGLVDVWRIRADAYTRLAEALDAGDDEGWRRGRALADKAKLAEEQWFNTTNARLESEGVTLDQFP
jgi:hypothetical protein